MFLLGILLLTILVDLILLPDDNRSGYDLAVELATKDVSFDIRRKIDAYAGQFASIVNLVIKAQRSEANLIDPLLHSLQG